MNPGGEPQPQVGGQVDDLRGEEGEDAPTHGGGAAPAVAAAAQQAAAAYPKIIQDPSSSRRVLDQNPEPGLVLCASEFSQHRIRIRLLHILKGKHTIFWQELVSSERKS